MNSPKVIAVFRGEWRFLSNFYPAEVHYDGMVYPSVEHAYQAAKTLSSAWREHIRKALTPGSAKYFGALVTLRPNWEEEKLTIMEGLLQDKFSTEPLRSQLLATGDAILIEGNTWGDRFWGVCGGKGENHLGRLLMKVRSQLQEERAPLEEASEILRGV